MSVESGRYKAAEVDLKTVLGTNRQNAEARLSLAQVYLELGDGPSAQSELEVLLSNDSTQSSVLPLLARALLLQARLSDTTELAIPAEMPNIEQADLQSSIGIAWLGLEQVPKARVYIEGALELSSELEYARYAHALLLLTEGEQAQAESELHDILLGQSTYWPALALLGDVAVRTGKFDEAEQFYSQAIANKTASTPERFKRALVRVQLGRYADAEVDLEKLRKVYAKHSQINYLQGLVYYQQEELDRASPEFEEALRLNPRHTDSMFYAGYLSYLGSDFELAEQRIQGYLAANPNNAPAMRILATIKLSQGDAKGAERIIRNITREEDMDVYTLTLLASSLFSQNLHAEARQVYEQIVNLQPESVEYRTSYAQALMNEGSTESAVLELERAIDIDPEFDRAQEQLVLTLIENNQYEKALEVATQYHDSNPERTTASLLLGAVYLQLKRVPEAESAFNRALELSPHNSWANNALATVSLQRGDVDRAKQYYLDTLTGMPGDLATLLSLASLQEAEGDLEGMQETLETAVQANAEALRPRLLLARHLINQGRSASAIQVLSPMREDHSSNIQMLSLMASAQYRTNDFEGAGETLRRLIELNPDSEGAHLTLSQVYLQLGDGQRYLDEMNQVIRLNPENSEVRFKIIESDLALGRFPEAERNIDILVEQVGERPDTLLLQGRLQQEMGKPEEALAFYRKAHLDSPNNISMLAQVGALKELGRGDDVVILLGAWLKDHPEDWVSRLELAHTYLQMGDEDAADRAYRQVLEISPGNHAALNDLAWTLKDRSPDEAVKYARQAVELVPQSASYKDTYAMALRSAGDSARARTVIDKAVEAEPEKAAFRFHRAQILNDMDDKAAALEELDGILDSGAEFEGREEAMALQKSIRLQLAE